MKKKYVVVSSILILLLLTGCGSVGKMKDDNTGTEISYELDRENKEIIVDDVIYTYKEDENGICFQYPDGTNIVIDGDLDTMVISEEKEITREYIQPDTLYEIYLYSDKLKINPVGIWLCIVGILMFSVPQIIWYIDIGWLTKIKKNNIALGIIRVAGIVGFFCGIYYMFLE